MKNTIAIYLPESVSFSDNNYIGLELDKNFSTVGRPFLCKLDIKDGIVTVVKLQKSLTLTINERSFTVYFSPKKSDIDSKIKFSYFDEKNREIIEKGIVIYLFEKGELRLEALDISKNNTFTVSNDIMSLFRSCYSSFDDCIHFFVNGILKECHFISNCYFKII